MISSRARLGQRGQAYQYSVDVESLRRGTRDLDGLARARALVGMQKCPKRNVPNKLERVKLGRNRTGPQKHLGIVRSRPEVKWTRTLVGIRALASRSQQVKRD